MLFQTLLLLGLLCLDHGTRLDWAGRRGHPTRDQTTPTSAKPIQTRAQDPTPLPGLIHQPLCDACAPAAAPWPPAPSVPPPRLMGTRGRRRTVDLRQPCCPDADGAYDGWVGRGHRRAKGHPGGKPWRPLACVSCHGSVQETQGTPLHGQHVSPQLLGWAVRAVLWLRVPPWPQVQAQAL